MSTGDTIPATQFTIKEAIAWIIWREGGRPLRPDYPHVNDGDGLRQPETPGAAVRSWWDDTADIERPIRHAARNLADKISAGTVHASGWRVTEGAPTGDVSDSEYVDRIPAAAARYLCQIPVEWIEVSNGGWLLVQNRMLNGMSAGERYCRVTVDAKQVKAIWPKRQYDRSDLVEWMTAEARRVLDTTGHKVKRETLIQDCIKVKGCTNPEAEEAIKDVPSELRRTRGERD